MLFIFLMEYMGCWKDYLRDFELKVSSLWVYRCFSYWSNKLLKYFFFMWFINKIIEIV